MVKPGYVIDKSGNIFVQIPDDNEWGFSIATDDQTWPGGFGINDWAMISDDDPRITEEVKATLGWLLEEEAQP